MQNYEPPETDYFLQTPLKKEVLDNLPPSPNNPPWNIWAGLGAWIASIAFIIIFPNLFVLPYLTRQNLDFADKLRVMEFARTDPTAILLGVGAVFPAHIFTLVLAWLIITRFNKFSFFEMTGWKWGGYKWWQILSATLILVVGFFVLGAVFVNVFGNPDNDLTLILKSSKAAVYLVAFLATFTAPLIEEVIYRGILYSAVQRSLGVYWGVIIVTVLFAGVHVPQYWGSTATIIMICLLSLTLTIIRVKTKNLLPCIALHMVLNGIQGIAMVAGTFVPEKSTDQALSFLHLFK